MRRGGKRLGSLAGDLAMLRRGRDWRGRARTPRALVAEEHAAAADPEPFPTAWARTAPAVAVRGAFQRGVLKPFVWTRNRPVIEGVEHLSTLRGPAVFVSNHASHMDTPLILGALPRRIADRVAVGAAADHFFVSPVAGTTTALLFNAFPVDRYGARRGGRGLATQLVDEGWSLLLYPEGTRTPDGWINTFKLGAARLCLDAGIPAVPVAVRGTFAAMPRGKMLPDRDGPRICVRFGRPLRPLEGESTTEFRNRLAARVGALWAEEDLGWPRAARARCRSRSPRWSAAAVRAAAAARSPSGARSGKPPAPRPARAGRGCGGTGGPSNTPPPGRAPARGGWRAGGGTRASGNSHPLSPVRRIL
jgi:1-acyl-sn-glycerol-3-phosphate acyltransferase